MKVGLVAASLVLVAGGATGCGGGSATTEEFCQGYLDFSEALFSTDSEDAAENIEAVKDAAQEFEDVGVPDDMSDDAQEGLEIILDAIGDMDEDSTLEELDGDLSDEEQKKVDAFEKFLDKCEGFGEPDESAG